MKTIRKYRARLIWCLCLLLSIAGAYGACLLGKADVLADSLGDRVLKPVLGFIPSLLPVSLFEILIPAGIAIIIVYVLSLTYGLVKKKNKWDFFVGKISAGLLFALIIALLFELTYGTYYYREPLSQKLGFSGEGYTKEELFLTTQEIVLKLNEASQSVSRDGQGRFVLQGGKEGVLNRAKEAYDRSVADYPFLQGNYAKPKGLLISPLMNYLFIDGIYFPLTVEANLNTAGHNLFFPSATLHEMAHQRGIAREGEANFIAYAVGTKSDDPDFVYSGYILAYTHLANALYSEDKSLFSQVSGLLEEKVRLDFADYNTFLSQYVTPAKEISQQVNDRYLKINGQENGIKSYGDMVDLLIGEYVKIYS